MSLVRFVEEASLNAWPSLNILFYDGWVLRFAGGYTKRANSASALCHGELPLEAKVAYCEQKYRQQGLQPIFRLTPLIEPELDGRLASRGYEQIDITSVQGCALHPGLYPLSTAVQILSGQDGLATWLQIFHRLNPARRDIAAHEAILQRVISRVCPMVLRDEEVVVACGLGVAIGDYVGLFDIVTAEGQRRKGFGRELTRSLLAWGQEQGATQAYLQVMLSNKPARRLYEQMGFAEIYRYWYRITPEKQTAVTEGEFIR
jgi:ribosomal protein S18 acetylase RimI-like enzyme